MRGPRARHRQHRGSRRDGGARKCPWGAPGVGPDRDPVGDGVAQDRVHRACVSGFQVQVAVVHVAHQALFLMCMDALMP